MNAVISHVRNKSNRCDIRRIAHSSWLILKTAFQTAYVSMFFVCLNKGHIEMNRIWAEDADMTSQLHETHIYAPPTQIYTRKFNFAGNSRHVLAQ